MYVRVIDNVAERYTITDLRRANSNVSFPKEVNDRLLADFGVYPLVSVDPPTGDVVTEGTPVFNNSTKQWEQSWVARDFTAEEVAEQLARKREVMVVTPRQARLALLGAGLLDQIEAGIAALPEPTKTAVTIEWEYATHVDRNSQWVGALAQALKLTDEQLDQLFEVAATL